ncbi:hypothetical protein D3C79_894210 [compost metagenome]
MAKGVGLDSRRVGEVPSIVEAAGLNLIIDDPYQALGVGQVCGRGIAGDGFPAQFTLVTEIHADVVAANFDSSSHFITRKQKDGPVYGPCSGMTRFRV